LVRGESVRGLDLKSLTRAGQGPNSWNQSRSGGRRREQERINATLYSPRKKTSQVARGKRNPPLPERTQRPSERKQTGYKAGGKKEKENCPCQERKKRTPRNLGKGGSRAIDWFEKKKALWAIGKGRKQGSKGRGLHPLRLKRRERGSLRKSRHLFNLREGRGKARDLCMAFHSLM